MTEIRRKTRRLGTPIVTVLLTGALAFALGACAGSDAAHIVSPSSPAAAPAAYSELVDPTAGLVMPVSVHTSAGADVARARAVVHTAQVLYTFWNTGDTLFLDRAITTDFHDNTLPPGRPQGPAGPRAASAAFRVAVPDLSCQLVDLYVTGDSFTARLEFAGHFTGTLNGIQGHGQPVKFNAIDIQHVGAGVLITEDWHLEDNLTFLQQAGLVTIAGAP